jgi:hypothetical protein
MKKIEKTKKEDRFKETAKPRLKDHLMYVRLPNAVADRLKYQANRLACSMNLLTRMALVRLLEEEEAKERQNKA